MLLSYENEAIFAQQNGQDIDYVVPDQTILIENPVAITTDSANPTAAKALLDYVYTPEAQKIFADNGYRPVVTGVVPDDQFPTPAGLFTIDDLGGWPDVATKFFDTKTGIIADHRDGQRRLGCLQVTPSVLTVPPEPAPAAPPRPAARRKRRREHRASSSASPRCT